MELTFGQYELIYNSFSFGTATFLQQQSSFGWV